MRFRRLELIAFGPFTDRVLEFGEPGAVEIVFGPNEAGKSSALRAITGFLFGIPERTGDAHEHKMPMLAIGASVQGSGGEGPLALVRRKKRKDPLVDAQGDPVPEPVLRSLLGDLTEEVFRSTFGLNHRRLRRGGAELVSGGGELGQSLFGAGLGHGVQQVLVTLKQRAEAIYSPTARKKELNAALKSHKEARRTVKGLILRPDQWEKTGDEVARLEQELSGVVALVRTHQREQRNLEDRQKLIPLVAEHDRRLEERASLGEVVLLPQDAAAKREGFEERIAEADVRVRSQTAKVSELEGELERLSVPEALLHGQEEIEGIHEDLGAYRKAMKDRPQRKGELRTLRNEIESTLRRLGKPPDLARAEEIEVNVQHESSIRDQVKRRGILDDRAEGLKRQEKERLTALDGLQASLARLPAARDLTPVADALRAARGAEQLRENVRRAGERHDRIRASAERQLAALGLWSGSLADAGRLPLPPEETVTRFRDLWVASEKDEHRLAEKDRDLRERCDTHRGQIEDLRKSQAIPTEEDLEEARERRETGWALIRRDWLESEDVSAEATALDPDRALPDAYEQTVQRADDISDHMRREADRVAQLFTLRLALSRSEEKLAKVEEERSDLETRRASELNDWREVWSRVEIEPLPPFEMDAWLTRHAALVNSIEELETVSAEQLTLSKLEDEYRERIATALRDAGAAVADEDLATLLPRAERLVAEEGTRAEERRELERSLREQTRSLELVRSEAAEVERESTEWEERWKESLAALGMEENTPPEAAEDFLDALNTLRGLLRETRDLEKRIAGIDRDATVLEEKITTLVSECSPEISGLGMQEAGNALWNRLKQAIQDRKAREEQKKALDQHREDLAEASERLEVATRGLDSLKEQAAVQSLSALREAEERSKSAMELDSKLRQLRERIDGLAPGRSLEAIREEVAGLDPTDLPGRVEEVRSALAEQERLRDDLVGEIATLRRDLDGMDGTSKAAEEAAQASEDLALIRELTERYARDRLAAHLLERGIEDYRRSHQGPLMARAGELFGTLTCGGFERLESDYDSKGNQRLLCVRSSGEPVELDGLSDGTADQLYLALRLAAVEHHTGAAEPIPFVADDLFVHFDDDRARAGLLVLAELAKTTQVLLFTHHGHLRDLAVEALGDRARIHELEGPAGRP